MPDETSSERTKNNQVMSPQPNTPNRNTSGLAIAAIICAFLLPPIGLILGIVALVKIKKHQSQGGKTLAIVAILLSVLNTLIIFPIVLGAVMMNVSRLYVEDAATDVSRTSDTSTECPKGVSIDVVEVDGTPELCYDEDEGLVDVALQNRGNVNIAGFFFDIHGSLN
ncbi:MAG: DUF4190 domain-containing protein [Candidatus Woesearchaeota archaeon]